MKTYLNLAMEIDLSVLLSSIVGKPRINQKIIRACLLVSTLIYSSLSASPDWDTELLTAARDNDVSRVRVAIRSGANVDATTSDGFTALFAFVRHGNKAGLRLLIDSRANVNAVSSDGATPLIEAVVLGKLDIARMLLAAGARGNRGGFRGNALHFAVRQQHHVIIEPLLKAGGNPNDMDNDGVSAFHLAVLQRDAVAVRLFIKYGADVNARGPRGRTPLMICYLSENGSLKQRGMVLGLLIDAKAELNLRDEDGHTLLDMSERGFELVLTDQLRKAGAKKGSEMSLPAESQSNGSTERPATAEPGTTDSTSTGSTSGEK